jgi:hypothetical protein
MSGWANTFSRNGSEGLRNFVNLTGWTQKRRTVLHVSVGGGGTGTYMQAIEASRKDSSPEIRWVKSNVLLSTVRCCWNLNSGSHSSGYEAFCLLNYNVMYSIENVQSFWRNMSPPSSGKRETSMKEAATKHRRWRRPVPPKCRLIFNGLHGITFQKIEVFCDRWLLNVM